MLLIIAWALNIWSPLITGHHGNPYMGTRGQGMSGFPWYYCTWSRSRCRSKLAVIFPRDCHWPSAESTKKEKSLCLQCSAVLHRRNTPSGSDGKNKFWYALGQAVIERVMYTEYWGEFCFTYTLVSNEMMRPTNYDHKVSAAGRTDKVLAKYVISMRTKAHGILQNIGYYFTSSITTSERVYGD